MLRKKLRGKIIKRQFFLEESINLYKNNSTSESHRFNYVKSYRNLPCHRLRQLLEKMSPLITKVVVKVVSNRTPMIRRYKS
jgi:hypothetical protein